MSVQTTTYDVFLSYSSTEVRTAQLVEDALVAAGLDVFNPSAVHPEVPRDEVLWKALAETAALVVIIHSERVLGSSTAVEVGAAMAWHKPIYVVHAGNGTARSPAYLERFPAYPVSRIDDVVWSIKRSLKTLSDEERDLLGKVYVEFGVPADRLLQNPASLEDLARQFNSRCHTSYAGEILIQEILRLRKSARLPRLRKG